MEHSNPLLRDNDSTQKFMEATERQKQIIKKLLSDYPDSKDLYEYQDYLENRSREFPMVCGFS